MRRKPDFIGVGVQKAGTSWLAACLDAHPGISIPIKETRFFTHWYELGVERYETKIGRGCPSGVIVGEFCTQYFPNIHVSRLVKNHYPDTKIMVVLRHPVERVQSIMRHRLMRGRDPNVEHAMKWSRYADNLEEWLGRFPDMKIVFYEELKESPHLEIKKFYEYLGVDSTFVPPMLHTTVNRSVSPKSYTAIRVLDSLGGLRYKWPWKKWWWKRSAIDFRDLVKRLNQTDYRPALNRKERKLMLESFRDDIERVNEIVGRVPWSWHT